MKKQFLRFLFFNLCVLTRAQQTAPHTTLEDAPVSKPNDSTDAYSFAGTMPLFQGGGDEAFVRYIQSRVIYPKDARELKIQGTVYVQYIIEKDGSVTNVVVLPGKGVYPSIDQAAIDVIKSSPKWTPGLNNGKPVRVKKIARIKFSLL